MLSKQDNTGRGFQTPHSSLPPPGVLEAAKQVIVGSQEQTTRPNFLSKKAGRQLQNQASVCTKTLFFKNIVRFPAKSRTEIFHVLPASIQTSPTVHIPYQSATFVSTDEPTLTHHSHPKSIVYIRAHSWCCIFSGFGYTCKDAYPLL